MNDSDESPSYDLTATFAVSEAIRGGMEPAGATTSLRVAADGFHAVGGMGSAGQPVQPLSTEHVADLLTQNFDREQLHALLGHVVRLHDALA